MAILSPPYEITGAMVLLKFHWIYNTIYFLWHKEPMVTAYSLKTCNIAALLQWPLQVYCNHLSNKIISFFLYISRFIYYLWQGKQGRGQWQQGSGLGRDMECNKVIKVIIWCKVQSGLVFSPCMDPNTVAKGGISLYFNFSYIP